MLLDNLFIVIAMFFWFSYFPIALVSLVRVLQNRHVFVEKHPKREHDASIIFQITTRSATKTHVVRRGIQSVIDSAHKIDYRDYKVSVVTDDPEDLVTLRDVKCEVAVVPSDFKTNAIRKGRALQYAVEHRRRTGDNTKDYWVFHMDDESYVTSQTILALLKSIENGKEMIASEGPIFYPLKFEDASRITALAESIRPFACYDCVSQMTNPPPLHIHGSNLLVRSDVEDDIEWKFGPTLAEDQMFGFKVYEKYGPESMGWHGGVLLEQPPLNIRDHFFQRRRWVFGTLQNLANFPRWHRFKLIYKSLTYFLGFASAATSTSIMLYSYLSALWQYDELSYNIMTIPDRLPFMFFESLFEAVAESAYLEIGVGSILLFTSIVWISSYQLGLFLNLRYSKVGMLKRLKFHFQTLFLSPVIGLVETFPAFWATIEYYFKKKERGQEMPVYDFYVVAK